MERTAQRYFKDVWPVDTEWINKLRIEFPDIMREVTPKSIEKDIVITCDTDSVDGSSIINTNSGKIKISELFDKSNIFNIDKSNGTEYAMLPSDITVQNYTNQKGLHYDKPLSIIRHKVSKARYRITTSSGKSLIVTDDHSLIVFRNNEKLSVKASELVSTDLILVVNANN